MLLTFNALLKRLSIMSVNRTTRSSKSRPDSVTTSETSKYFTEKTSNKVKTSTKRQRKDKPAPQTRESDNELSGEELPQKSTKMTPKEPNNWRIILENIRKMRDKRDAVVDSMGAEKTFDENEGNPKDKRFQVLISLMLSSQTRDELTYKTMQTLRQYGLTVSHIIDTSEEDLAKMIGSVSFYRNKSKYIKRTAIILRDQFDGDIPDTIDGLLSLPGVGPKMGHLAMKIAWNQLTGVAVDTHVHRICNRLNWTQTKTPEQTQKHLELWLPKDHWEDFNLLVVGFGQTICSAVKPKCGECLNRKICPFVKKGKALDADLDF